MKNKKIMVPVLVSSFVLASCGNSTEQLEKFYSKVDEANSKEKAIIDAGEELSVLEDDKQKLFNKISKGNKKVINETAEKLIENTKKREETVNTEIKAMDASEKIYESSKKDAKTIEDEKQKKEAADLIDKLDEKYSTHDKLMDGYHNILNKEKDIFTYLQGKDLSSKVVNQKIEKITKENDAFEKLTDDYTKTLREVEKEKKDIVDILNKK